MPSTSTHRPLSWTAWNGALERLKSHSQKSWWFIPAFCGLISAIAVSGPLSQRLFRKEDSQWWAVLILPACVALIGTPFLLALQRRLESLASRYPELICPGCGKPLDETVIRLTGCCCHCGLVAVEPPVRTRAAVVGDLDDLRKNLTQSGLWDIAVLFGPVCGFTLLSLIARFLQHQMVAATGFGLAMLSVAGGIAWLLFREFGRQGPFACSRCDWKPGADSQQLQWLLATGQCPGCGVARYVRANVPSVTDERKRPLRSIIEATQTRQSIMTKWLVGVLFVQWPVMWLCLRPGWWSLPGWLMLLGFFPLFIRTQLRLDRETTCPVCQKASLASPIAIATGGCPRCGAEVLTGRGTR